MEIFKFYNYITEAKKNIINKKYTHFALIKSSNKIINGWEYSGYDSDELNSDKNHYFFDDIKDMDYEKKDIKIVTKKELISRDIDPFDIANWNWKK